MKVLAIRLGSSAGVARAMGTTRRTLEHMMGRAGKPTAELALRAARLADVPVDARGVSEAGGVPDMRAV
jgi:2-methylcitrate dehydratase PrpD